MPGFASISTPEKAGCGRRRARGVALRRLLDALNMRLMRGYGTGRADLFATLDRPNLQPLPPDPHVLARPI